MLRLAGYDIVFQEIPGEVTLALNISGCPNRCKGCHSPHLWEDEGEILDEDYLSVLLSDYGSSVTCLCFMGGDGAPQEVERLSLFARRAAGGRLKTAWYSGKQALPEFCSPGSFDYIKLGPYVPECGGLYSPGTNQRFYVVEQGKMKDATGLFGKKKR